MRRIILFEWRKIRRNAVSSMAAMAGLALGLAVFILGALYIQEESAYDKGFSHHELLYRLEKQYPDGHHAVSAPKGQADLFAHGMPGIDQLTTFWEMSLEQPLLTAADGKQIFVEHLFHADTSFFGIFDYPFVFGNGAQAFSQPKSIVLSKAVAFALFNGHDPIGKPLKCADQGNYIVTGVFDNTRFPSHLTVDAIIPSAGLDSGASAWKNNSVYTYVRLQPEARASSVEKRLSMVFAKLPADWKMGGTSIVLDPVTAIYLHFRSRGGLDVFKKGNETALWLIACLVLSILLGSLVNFTNLVFTETSHRLKEIAIRQVVGSGRANVVAQIYLGVALRCLLAFGGAVVLVCLALPWFSELLQVNLHLFQKSHLAVWWEILLLLIVEVAISGTYPLFYISLARFSAVLKGSYNNGHKGNAIRKGMLVLQFTITCVFIAGNLIINKQLQYISSKDLGFNAHQVLVIRYGQLQTQYQYPQVKAVLSQVPGVQGLSYCSEGGILKDKFFMPLTIDGVPYKPHYLCVDTGYLSVMAAHFVDGRNFLNIDTGKAIIINQTLADLANIKDVTKPISVTIFGKPARILGIVKDLNLYGFENAIGPMAFTTNSFTLKPYLFVKLNTPDPRQVIAAIEKDWKTIEPGYPLRFQFLDQTFEQIYKGYDRLSGVYNVFSLSAILLAFSGLFSLSALIILQRSKEITIRKVHGAAKWSILVLLNKNFLLLIALSNAIALPLTYYLSHKWLDHFAYRTDITAWPFLLTFVASIVLTFVTVSLQSLKVISVPAAAGLRQE